eukprot:1346597-Pyramimonas_sp.AAC.1
MRRGNVQTVALAIAPSTFGATGCNRFKNGWRLLFKMVISLQRRAHSPSTCVTRTRMEHRSFSKRGFGPSVADIRFRSLQPLRGWRAVALEGGGSAC